MPTTRQIEPTYAKLRNGALIKTGYTITEIITNSAGAVIRTSVKVHKNKSLNHG